MPSCASTGKRSRLSKKTKARVEVGVQPCQEASLEKICHACTKGPNGEEWVKYHDRWFHKPCKRGVEAQHRSLRSADPSGEALNANVSQMLQDPETWRAEKFHYFRPDASNSERMDGHRKMKAEASTYNKSESFQSTFGFQDDVTIRKRHYWKWLCQFESIDEPTALRQFDNIHMVQGNKHDFNKEEAIKVSHPLKIDRGGKGNKTTTGTTQADACSDEVHRAFTQKCQRAMEGEDSDGSSAGELDERDFPSTKFYQGTSSSIDGQSNSTKAIPPTLSAGCSSEWASTLTMGGSEPWPDKRKKGTTTPPTTPSAKGSKKAILQRAQPGSLQSCLNRCHRLKMVRKWTASFFLTPRRPLRLALQNLRTVSAAQEA